MNSETIYTTLKHRILDLTLKPGQSMSEHELCERFGVSRTPVRTAVESQVILDFLPVCTPLLEEKIRYQIRKQMALIQGEFELSQFYEMDSHLHAIWFHATHKDKLWEMIQKAQIHYTRFRMLDIAENQNFSAIIREHRELFQIIHEKRAGEIAPLMHRHLYGSIGRLGEKLQTEFREYFITKETDN